MDSEQVLWTFVSRLGTDQALTLGVGCCTREAYLSHNFIGHAYRLPRSVISGDGKSVKCGSAGRNVQTKLKLGGGATADAGRAGMAVQGGLKASRPPTTSRLGHCSLLLPGPASH